MIDLNRQAELRDAIELMYFAYRSFTDGPDRILERRGLGRVHHRILYFIARRPGVSVRGLLATLEVSKQALNAPLRQLMEMNLVSSVAGLEDRRIRNLRLTPEGHRLEAELTGVQMRQLEAAFAAGRPADEAGWRRIMACLSPAAEIAP
jgi:DNA-binding MarR family transcriptional regulator